MTENPKQLSPEKIAELRRMQEWIRSSLNDPATRAMVKADYMHTFQALGLPEQAAGLLCTVIFQKMIVEGRLDGIEADILAYLQTITVEGDGRNLPDILDEKLSERADLIFSQTREYLEPYRDENGRVLDWGCGDGQVTQKLADELGLDISGYDVRKYPAPSVTVPIHEFDGRNLPVDAWHFDAAVVTNVWHHDADNEQALAELTRTVKGRLVVIETVPTDDSKAQRDRTFMNDYLYNRLFHNADVPVPGAFETAENWPGRLAKHGWRCVEQTHLGYDQATIMDCHVLYVFERDETVDELSDGFQHAAATAVRE